MKTQSNSVIYQIPCECGKTYVGQTKVGINNRMKQHYKTITDDKDRNLEMIKHHQDMRYQCLFDIDKAFIIEEEKDYWKRRIKETIYSKISQSINTYGTLNEA
jgi:predicted GIY-YIG superfamily endonuclease